LYPPLFIACFTQLIALGDYPALLVFQALKWICLYCCLRLAWRICAPQGEDVPPIVAVVVLLLMFRYFANEIANGNINLFILAGVLAGVRLSQTGRSTAAGFVLSAMASIKVTPALLIVYLVYKGQHRALVGAALGAMVCLLLLPAFLLGWDLNWQLLIAWYHHIIAGFVAHGEVYSIGTNQGIIPLLNRLFGDAIAFEPNVRITLLRLPDALLAAARVAIQAGMLAAVAWACRGRLTRATSPLAFAAEVAIVQIATLALSGYTWKSHYVAMALPYSVLLSYLADGRHSPRGRGKIALAVIVSVVLMMLSSDLLTPTGADYALAYGVVFFSGLAAMAGLMALRSNLRDQTPEPTQATDSLAMAKS
jgi:hypothetical protein